MQRAGRIDYPLLLITLLLVSIGLIAVLTAGIPVGYRYEDDPYAHVRSQVKWVVLGLVLLLVISRIDYHWYARLDRVALLLVFVTLLAVYAPVVGHPIRGVRRWIMVGPVQAQPSELAKVGLVIYLAVSMVRKRQVIESFLKGFLPYFLIIGMVFLLVVGEPDLGSALILGILGCILMYAGGVRIRHLLYAGVLAGVAVYFAVCEVGYRQDRILAFMSPESDPQGIGYQPLHLMMSLGAGGWWGVGPGRGHTKLHYLPTPHTDSIFAVLGEEFGFVGTTVVVCLFGLLAYRGYCIARKASDSLGRLLALGFCCLICVQALINMGVATVLLPTTGTPLPLVSYGGSAMLVNLTAIGVLLSISRHAGHADRQRLDDSSTPTNECGSDNSLLPKSGQGNANGRGD